MVPGSTVEKATRQGVASGEFRIPRGLPEGRYALAAASSDPSFLQQRRHFVVAEQPAARPTNRLEFTRPTYSPGEKVVAGFSAQRGEGSPVSNAVLRIAATVGGKKVYENRARASAAGTFKVEFRLPDNVERGDGQLAVTVNDAGQDETTVKAFHINSGPPRIAFYPEGGTLVTGLENRLYFTATDSLGNPATVNGRIVDRLGRPVALNIETTSEGRGAFPLTPAPGEQYRFQMDTPGAQERPRCHRSRRVRASC